MGKRIPLGALIILLCSGLAGADWIALCDFGRPCDGTTLNPASDGQHWTNTNWSNLYDLLSAADGSDTGADIDLRNSYTTIAYGNPCPRVKNCGTDGTYPYTVQVDGQAWDPGHRYDNVTPDWVPWTYEIYFTGLDPDKLYDFEFYANCPSGDPGGHEGTGVSTYTIAGQTAPLAHTDNCNPSETVWIGSIAPYTFDAIGGFTDDGAGGYLPVYDQRFGIKLELSDGAIIGALRIAEVPEPASAMLLGLGALFLARRRRQPRQV